MKRLAKTNKQNAELENEEKTEMNEEQSGVEKTNPETNADESGGDDPGFEKELADEKDKYLRLAAEYDNYRKRSAKEREMIYSDARVDAITKLLPVYDNLERALNMDCADEAYYKGIEMIMTQLNEILESLSVKKIPAVGEQFDPNRHNAVMTIENPELGEKTIAEEYQKGFTLGDRVIRFSTVVVAN
jgi:molecular chaperone GrpE